MSSQLKATAGNIRFVCALSGGKNSFCVRFVSSNYDGGGGGRYVQVLVRGLRHAEPARQLVLLLLEFDIYMCVCMGWKLMWRF